MKKLFAILVSAILLCAMIPFATVSAADEPTIVLEPNVTEVNAGDTFDVAVSLKGNPGVISAVVDIVYDKDVFELVIEEVYNEDDDEYVTQNKIVTAAGWSSKYITDSPLGLCRVSFCNGTATKDVTKELFYTATLKVKDGVADGHYELTVGYDPANFFNVAGEDVTFGAQGATITVGNPAPPACEHEYAYDCSKVCSKCGEETRPEADHIAGAAATCTNAQVCTACGIELNPILDHSYYNDCDAICMVCGAEREVSHNVIHVDALAPTCTEIGNVEYWYCDVCGAAWLDAECTIITNLMSVKLGATCATNAIHSEGAEAGCHYTGWTENWYCANCDVYYLDAACTIITNYKSLTIPALQDSADYVAAKTPTCTENGNVEYWTCAECEQVWADEALTQLTNIMNVQIAPSCKYGAEHVEAVAAGCENQGNVEYWYCANCDVFYLDAECTVITNGQSIVLPIVHNIIHVAAKDATCTELGNIEYWYCADCGQAWLDELCHYNTNLMAVILPMAEHTYDNVYDADCNVCGTVRDITLSESDIIIESGKSVSEDKAGLAFKFDVYASGITFDANAEYIADYTNATVKVDGVEYKLVGMGAILNNQGYTEQTLENVDDAYVLDVPAMKAFSLVEGATEADSFAVRVLNIPAEYQATEIIARPYFIYENAEGEQFIGYGADYSASYASVIEG